MHRLEQEQFFPQPREKVFAFFEKPENLGRITPPWMSFTLTTPSPVVMAQGLVLDYRIRVFGFSLRWTSRITAYRSPETFVDEEVRGPYRIWKHRHSFEEKDGGTLMRDDVEYDVGWGVLGELAHAVYVRRALDAIFDHRRHVITPLLA